MDITKELIQNFFNKQCTPEEAAAVSVYLNDNPELLNQYLTKNEWDENDITSHKPDHFWDEIWDTIQEKKNQRSTFNWRKKLAIAATIVGIFSATGWWFITKQNTQKQLHVAMVFTHKTIKNTNKDIKQITLNDGSIVSLSSNSVLEFDEPFQNNKRNVYLKGEAVFKIAKDKLRPFTVFSGAVATTALGTKFKVTSYEYSNAIKVLLYEGKVVVKSPKLARAMYLKPGNELTYNKTQMQATINSMASKATAKITNKTNAKVAWLAFNKEALSDVFDKLAEKYQTPIHYTNSDLTQLYFIGSFDKNDTLENILQTIGKLNGLKTIKNSDGGYLITK